MDEKTAEHIQRLISGGVALVKVKRSAQSGHVCALSGQECKDLAFLIAASNGIILDD